jgi:hypothetical protein
MCVCVWRETHAHINMSRNKEKKLKTKKKKKRFFFYSQTIKIILMEIIRHNIWKYLFEEKKKRLLMIYLIININKLQSPLSNNKLLDDARVDMDKIWENRVILWFPDEINNETTYN